MTTQPIEPGMKYDMLTIVERLPIDRDQPKWKQRLPRFLCSCDCGKEVVKTSRYLKDNRNANALKSCGCSASDYLRKRNTQTAKHRLSTDRRYIIWSQIKQRCYNPKHNFYSRYGGRGIKVADRWIEPETGFINFIKDMGERPSDANYASGRSKYTVDRIDTDGDYTPENCRWATYEQQWETRHKYIKGEACGRKM